MKLYFEETRWTLHRTPWPIYPILMKVGGINIYTKAHMTDASDQVGRIYIGRKELKVRRIGHNAMLEQDAAESSLVAKPIWQRMC